MSKRRKGKKLVFPCRPHRTMMLPSLSGGRGVTVQDSAGHAP